MEEMDPNYGKLTPEEAEALGRLSANPLRQVEIDKRRALAAMLAKGDPNQHTSPLGALFGALTDVTGGLEGGFMQGQASAQERAMADEYARMEGLATRKNAEREGYFSHPQEAVADVEPPGSMAGGAPAGRRELTPEMRQALSRRLMGLMPSDGDSDEVPVWMRGGY